MAVRSGPWKAHFMTQKGYGQANPETHDPPLLFHLENDPSERFNLADKHSDVVAKIREMAAQHSASFNPPPSQLDAR